MIPFFFLIYVTNVDSHPPVVDIGYGIAPPIGSRQACPVLIEGVVSYDFRFIPLYKWLPESNTNKLVGAASLRQAQDRLAAIDRAKDGAPMEFLVIFGHEPDS